MTGRCAHAAASAIAAAAAFSSLLSLAAASVSSWERRSDDDYLLFVENRMDANMHLSCSVAHGGDPHRSEFFHSFRADPGQEEPLPFLWPEPGRAPPLRVVCKWAYDGNYMRGVTLFSSAWPEDGECRLRGGGCAVVFEGWQMFIVGRERGERGRLLGDVPEYECQKVLVFFHRRCWYKKHQHPYVGRVMGNLAEYMIA